MKGWAGFDSTGSYRYSLGRRWSDHGGTVCFCLLNPSTADARVLDPTLTRCLGFARRWGFGAMEVVNAFAWRSTDPAALRRSPDPVGPGNDRAILRAARRSEVVVVGWGNHGSLAGRGVEVGELLRRACRPRCWGVTKEGHPKHPLYLRADAELMPFEVSAVQPARAR